MLSADEIATPLRAILRNQANVEIRMGEVTGVDTRNRIVHVEPRDLSYDYSEATKWPEGFCFL